MIKVENLTVSFENNIILNNVTLDIDAGETMVIFGKNGSGKSVLLKAIAGLIQDYKGIIKINGIDIKQLHNKKALKNYDFNTAYVFQKGGLFDSMNVFENVAFPLRRKGITGDDIPETVMCSLKRVGLSGSEQKLPSELSGGMQKRVGLARAICVDPDIILYDDPTAGLDPILSDSIADVINQIKSHNKTASMIATHDLKIAKKIAEKAALLYKGEMVFSGSVYDFFNGDNVYAKQFIEAKLEGPIDIF
ncbi:MAG: ATP-binding cassette domain-containing protein [Spirochaetes bacterium]|nr:ATP-binding cassette domain-containing protein [Spirochaetota bacterium]